LAEAPAEACPTTAPAPTFYNSASVGAFSWSPDGKRIAFSASRDPDLGSGDTETLYVLDLADLHVKELLESGEPSGNPKWSPDGKEIAYVTSNGQPFFFYANRHVAVIPAEGGLPRLLTREFDEGLACSTGDRTASISRPPRRPPPTSSASTRRPAPSAASAGPMPSTPAAHPSPRITARWPPPAPRPTASPRFSFLPRPISRRSISPASAHSTRISASPPAR